MKSLFKLKSFFEKIDRWRDELLFKFIKPYWPRSISPNQLTVFRIIIGIFLFVILFFYKNDDATLIISLFCLGAFSDLLDGSVARGLNQETQIGAMLDPAADRILIIPIAVYSLFVDYKWLLLWLLILEIINALISIYAHGKGIFIKSNIFGKIKMFLQSVVFAAILILWPQTPNIFFIYVLWLSVAFIMVSIYFKILEISPIKSAPLPVTEMSKASPLKSAANKPAILDSASQKIIPTKKKRKPSAKKLKIKKKAVQKKPRKKNAKQ